MNGWFTINRDYRYNSGGWETVTDRCTHRRDRRVSEGQRAGRRIGHRGPSLMPRRPTEWQAEIEGTVSMVKETKIGGMTGNQTQPRAERMVSVTRLLLRFTSGPTQPPPRARGRILGGPCQSLHISTFAVINSRPVAPSALCSSPGAKRSRRSPRTSMLRRCRTPVAPRPGSSARENFTDSASPCPRAAVGSGGAIFTLSHRCSPPILQANR